ncbi:hypothetical protein AB0912_15655 [Streptomyces sp. NPDC007084]|uniref:hypothetical protein n=1 Tax=Streptomyces sp. NPDC007084 TaxID=3154313 RepID=UPI0034539304
MTASNGGAEQPRRRLNRAERRHRKREFIKQFLDGPPKPLICGQAKAAARARSANAAAPGAPKGDPSVKAQARELQAATGQPYGVCLAEVRTREQEARKGEGEQ